MENAEKLTSKYSEEHSHRSFLFFTTQTPPRATQATRKISLTTTDSRVIPTKADHLVVGNQLMCSSLGKTISLIPNSPSLSIVLCAALRPHRLFLLQFEMPIDIQLTFEHSCW